MQTQTKVIKAHLEDGKTINPMEALICYGCFRLAARIKNLKDSGMIIDKVMKQDENGKRYAMYWEVK